jgi:chromosomal replication initiation ATPase DnaA
MSTAETHCVEPSKRNSPLIPVRVIIDAVVEAYGITHENIMDREHRRRPTPTARQHCYWMMKKLYPNMPLLLMAGHLNSTNHTDAIYGCRKFAASRKNLGLYVDKVMIYIEHLYGETHPHLLEVDFDAE